MKNDFDFYDGVEQDSSVVQDIKGLTDEVSKYIYSNMDFPCICVKENIKLPKHALGLNFFTTLVQLIFLLWF